MAESWSKLVMPVVVLSCWVSVARGQQDTPPASPAASSQAGGAQTPDQTQAPPSQTNPSSQGEEQTPPTTEMPPLSSGITLEPGSEGSTLSYLLPSMTWTGFIDRLYTNSAEQSGTLTRSTYLGNLVLQQVHRRTQINLDYTLGAQLYGKPSLTNSKLTPPSFATMQKLSASGTVKRRRVELTVADQFMYTPESSFGSAGFAGLQGFGGGSGGNMFGNVPQINQLLSPTESLLNGSVSRYLDVALVEVRYSPTARSVFTATADAGVINYLSPGYVDARLTKFYGGYNYKLTSRDELSVIVLNSGYSFSGGNHDVINRGLLFGYGHQFSTRLAVNLVAGPSQIEIAQSGATLSEPLFITSDSLKYRSRIANLDVHFTQYTSEGSGVSRGAKTDLLRATLERRVTRRWHGGFEFGHAFNQSLRHQQGTSQASVETWESGLRLSREVTQRASLSFHYQYQYQRGAIANCTTLGCGTATARHLLGFGINWHGRPRRI